MTHQTRHTFQCLILCVALVGATAETLYAAPAGAALRLKREAAELIIKQSGKRASRELVEQTMRQLDDIARVCGRESIEIINKRGFPAYRLFRDAGEEAGPHLVRAVKLYGDDALRIGQTAAGRTMLKNGSPTAIRAIARHSDAVIPLVQRYGDDGARVLTKLSPHNGRRLVQLADSQTIPAKGISDLMGVVDQHGNRAMNFIWRNKGALAVTALLATFVRNPEPYLDGTKTLAVEMGKEMGGIFHTMAATAAGSVRWNFWVGLILAFIGLKTLIRGRRWCFRRRQADAPATVETTEKK